MKELREAVADSSPSGQHMDSIQRGGLLERLMVNHISSVALRLPEEFDESSPLRTLRVHGGTSDGHTAIKIEEDLPQEGAGAMQFTDIELARSALDQKALTKLSAERYVTDDVGELYGCQGSRQTYELGAEDNTLSLFRVMRCVGLAARTIDDARQLEYLSRPEASLPQTF